MPLFTRHAFLALLLLCAPLAAQDTATTAAETPEQVVERYFTLLQAEGLQSTVQFMHPDELVKLRSMLLPIFEMLVELDDRQLVDMTFGPEADADALTESTPEDFMSAFLRLIEAQMDGAELAFDQLDVLGHVPEGDVVHVLTRMTVGVEELSMTQLEVVSMRPYGDSWRMQLTGEIEGLAQMLQAQFEIAKAAQAEAAEAEAAEAEAAEAAAGDAEAETASPEG